MTKGYPYSEKELMIVQRTTQAMRYALLCGTGIGAPVFCILAFRAAAEATHLINQEGTLEGLLPRLLSARLIAGVITFSWLLLGCALLALVLLAQNASVS